MVLPLLFSALAPGLFGGAMSPLMASALGAGVGGLVESGGDLETGLLTGLGAFAGGSLLGPMLGGGAGAAAEAGAAGTAAAGTGAAVAAVPPVAAPVMPVPPVSPTATPGGIGSLFSGPAPGSTASMLGTTAPGGGGMLKDAFSFAKSPTGMGVGIGSALGASLAPLPGSGGGSDRDRRSSGAWSKEMKPIPRPYAMPGADYVGGVSPEFDYGGGMVPSAGEIIDFRDTGALPYSDGGLLRRYQSMMGPVRMAEGGIASLADMGGEQPPEQAPQGVSNEQAVMIEAVRAIKGQSENPQAALGVFLKSFGEDALRDLVERVKSGDFEGGEEDTGMVSGEGDGMEDAIPANIDNQQDVLLSDGEFVVPADVVSGLGNGSSDAGAQALESMMERVRQSRTGTAEQPPRVPQAEVMPV